MTQQVQNNLVSLKTALNSDGVKSKFFDMLGKKSAGFLTSITNVVQNNDLLQKADVNSILLASAQAAALDLPINPNLGLSAIIPFNDRKTGKCVAQFQIMRDGWVELCLRSGQFEYIVNEIVYEGELVEKNRFTDTYIFDETKRISNKIIGYVASFKLTNGYKKTLYMSIEEITAHGMQYSQTFKKGFGLWKDNFNAMALKTVLKLLLKKYAPKSIESISQAVVSDQASFVGTLDKQEAVYVDNQKDLDIDKEATEYEEVKEEGEQTTNAKARADEAIAKAQTLEF